MPAQDSRYRLNEPAVVADIIDGEAVIMNLERGNYYSLDRSGAAVWRLIVTGFSAAEIAAAAAARYGLSGAELTPDIVRLMAKLAEEQLIVAIGDAAIDRKIAADAFPAAVYAPPALAVYSDMKDLLALDPPLPLSKPNVSA